MCKAAHFAPRNVWILSFLSGSAVGVNRGFSGRVIFALLASGLVLGGCGGGGGSSAGAAPFAGPSPAKPVASSSRVTGLVVGGVQQLGTFNAVAYVRTYGTVAGVVDPRENVVGFASLAHDAAGAYAYTTQFEVIAPVGGAPANHTLYVDAENRGGPASLGALQEMTTGGAPDSAQYALGLGNGFLQKNATSYARVQWQTGVAAGVPAAAQGIGLAIVRDFARLLGGRAPRVASADGYSPGSYDKLILGGVSQSAWFVDTFVAEGFNADPVSGAAVFDAAIAIDGAGNWLAINALAASNGAPEYPYLAPQGMPLTPDALLSHPGSDPLFVDVANYTDFYRVRAGVSDVPFAGSNYRRYDWPSAHVQGGVPADPAIFAAGCNGGAPVALNPIGYAPYYRALVLAVEKQIGAANAAAAPPLPPSTTFALTPADASTANLNPLGSMALPVPRVDANAMPVGGVRFPDADVPLGRPAPVALPPVSTASMSATCGNYGMWQPLSGAQLAAAYGSKAGYLAQYDAALANLIARGYVLAADEQPMLARAASLYDAYAR